MITRLLISASRGQLLSWGRALPGFLLLVLAGTLAANATMMNSRISFREIQEARAIQILEKRTRVFLDNTPNADTWEMVFSRHPGSLLQAVMTETTPQP